MQVRVGGYARLLHYISLRLRSQSPDPPTHLGIMNKGLPLCVRRIRSCTDLLQAFDDGRFSSSVGPNDERQRLVELDHDWRVWREAAHALDLKPIESRHGEESLRSAPSVRLTEL